MTAVSRKIRSEVIRWDGRATARGPLLHECPHVVDRADGAGEIAIDQVVGEQGDRGRIVDLGQDELERWRLERDRDDPVAVGHSGEIGRRAERLGRVAHVLGHAQEQVVLGLARDQEVPGRGEEVIDVYVTPQLHARSIGSRAASDRSSGPSAEEAYGKDHDARAGDGRPRTDCYDVTVRRRGYQVPIVIRCCGARR